MADKGSLKVQCFDGDSYIPVSGVKVYVNRSELTENDTTGIGLTNQIDLDSPPIEYSLNPNINQTPYSLYDITVKGDGYRTLVIKGCQVFPIETAYQRCNLVKIESSRDSRQE